MNTSSCLLSILTVCLLVTSQLANGAKEESESRESREDETTRSGDETSTESTPTSGQIRQCTCTELAECSAKSREKFRPCADKCVDKLTDNDWNEEEGRKCFAHKQSDKKHCFEGLKNQTCAAEDGTMINKNETFRGFHGRHNHKKGKGSHEMEDHPAHPHSPHHGGKHHRNGFFSFIKKNFGESGKEYMKCMKDCFKKNKKGHCARSLKCGKSGMKNVECSESVNDSNKVN
uniref:Uncharacterized protein n=1 Tax=Ditylenchus dipsaci TaxID=166011 RepID=A0A915E0H3_9BILA